ncbi:MAG: LysR family transcriptional regulator [Oscillospiraceae bacterium]|jgi:DNA-binding transcriptional LysR family regulator|nr:LysR family transcriptional regulator [Oscillospiraceae bacterium]
MDITYDYYRIFYYSALYQSFTKAAKVLHNNQPNITRCMNNLERQLGCRLFVRSNKGIVLTPEGRQLYSHVAIAFEQIQAGEEELTRQRSMENGIISIGASETTLHLLLLDKLQLFHRLHPGIRLRISNHSTPQAIAALQNGLVDFAVVTTPVSVRRPLKLIDLHVFKEIPVGGPQYAAFAAEEHSLRDLLAHPFICLGEGTGTREFYRRYFAEHNLTLQADIEASTMDQVLPLVQHDLGISFYPEELSQQELETESIVQIPLVEALPVRTICLVQDASRPLSIAAKKLEKMLM